MTDADRGTCESCNEPFTYRLYHCGFSNCAYAYCHDCGRVSVLDEFAEVPSGIGFRSQGPIAKSVEPYLSPCPCGGTFLSDAVPRCPCCNQPLSASRATSYIESNAPGAGDGWHWQRSWTGVYCIDVGCRMVKDNWIGSKAVI